jgi:large subunit ribosomal protein L9
MRVILTEDVQGTGKKGQTVEVRDGFGRNFLVPKGLAIAASEGNLKRFENIVKGMAKKKERNLKSAQEIKERLEEITVVIKKKTGVDGKLFGSVTPKDIAEAIGKHVETAIDKRLVRVEEPIKMTGVYTVSVHLEEGIHASVKVEVEQET